MDNWIALPRTQEEVMGVKFEWRFDEGEHLLGGDGPAHQPTGRTKSVLRVIRSRICSLLRISDGLSRPDKANGAKIH